MNSEQVLNIKIRIKELENLYNNNKMDFLKYSKKYSDKLIMKYANKAFEAEKRMSKYKSLIEKYNKLLESENEEKQQD